MTHVTQNTCIVVYQVNTVTPTRGNQTHIFCGIGTDLVLGDRNTGILILCTILVYKFVPVL
jgi:hypothetical protein